MLTIFLFQLYGKKAWLYPGTWFCLIWIFATISYCICVYTDFYQEYFPKYIYSLNTKIFFTAFFFAFFSFFQKKKKMHHITFKPFDLSNYYRIYGICTVAAFTGAFGTWLYKGASFDIVLNRFDMIDHNIAIGMRYASAGQSMIEGLLNKLFLLNIPCSIIAGSVLALTLLKKKRKLLIKEKFFLLLPYVSWFFMTIATGGRKGFIDAAAFYAIGFLMSFTFMFSFNKKKLRLYFCGILIFILSFMVFSTIVRKARETRKLGGQYTSTPFAEKLQFLEPISGVVFYLADPFVGYQIKSRYRSMTKLSYGEKTFNGLFGFSIPLLDRIFHERVSIADYLGWDKLINTRWLFSNTPMATTIESIYFNMVSDFGEGGSILLIFILVLISHHLFISFFSTRKKHWSFLSIYLLTIFLMFWMNSIFSGYFAGTMPGAILKVFIFCELLNHFAKHKRYDFSFGLFRSYLPKEKLTLMPATNAP